MKWFALVATFMAVFVLIPPSTANAETPSVFAGRETTLAIPPLTEDNCPYETNDNGDCIRPTCKDGHYRIGGVGPCWREITVQIPGTNGGTTTQQERTATYATFHYGKCIANTVVATKKKPGWITINGLSVTFNPPSGVLPNKNAEFKYKIVGERTVRVQHHEQPRLTGPRDPEGCSLSAAGGSLLYNLRAAPRPSSVPRPEAHLHATPILSAPRYNNPGCYVIVTNHEASPGYLGGWSMTDCMPKAQFEAHGVPNDLRECDRDEHLPPEGAHRCYQPEGWTAYE